MNKDSLEIIVNLGNNDPFGMLLTLTLALHDLHKASGGSGLQFNLTDFEETEVLESPYELHPNTPFANTLRVFRQADLPRYIARQQVYDSLNNLNPRYASFERKQLLQKELEKRFPKYQFEDNFPVSATFNFAYHFLVHEEKV